jgi:hypothetical protein
MKVVELKKDMDAQFANVGERFERVNARFEQVGARFTQVDARITAEHETTRRHMDVLFEQLRAEYRLLLDKMTAIDLRLIKSLASNATDHAAFSTDLEQHETRITALERKTGSTKLRSST